MPKILIISLLSCAFLTFSACSKQTLSKQPQNHSSICNQIRHQLNNPMSANTTGQQTGQGQRNILLARYQRNQCE